MSENATTFGRENVFAFGKDAHTRWQGWMAQMGLLEGDWYCPSYQTTFYAQSPRTCGLCGRGDHIYDELSLTDSDLMIEGRTDGYIPSRGCLVEIKTVGEGTIRHADPALIERHRHETSRGTITDLKGLWDSIHKPFVSHLRQGQIYLYLARKMGLPVERIVFLYESKLTQDAKEFVVSYDEEMIAQTLRMARMVKLAYDGVASDPSCRQPGACKDCAALT